METKEKKVEFYGGAVGVWTPVIVMLIGMIINTVLAGGLTTLPMVTFLAMAVGFLLAKDKKTFGSVTLKGLQNPMFGTEAVAFIFAGILAQLLRQSGLIQALIYVVAQLELNTGLIPLIAFLTCMLISTACGTSTGSVTAVAPVLLPLAFSLDINPGLMCGAIISGAIFGDNLAPSPIRLLLRPHPGGGSGPCGPDPVPLRCRLCRRLCRPLCGHRPQQQFRSPLRH